MIKLFVFLTTILSMNAVPIGLQAQGVEQRLDSFYGAQRMKGQLNGNVLVAENDHILFRRSFGYADLQDSVLNTDQTLFDLASISKTFTATAVLQLMERHKIRLEDSFIKYFPSFPYAAVTIKNLLNHTSGLPDEDDFFDSLINKHPDSILTNADIIPALISFHHPLGFTPGDRWEYRNANYFLLALLIEKISHQKINDYFREHIFIPANMLHTRADQSAPRSVKDRLRSLNYIFPFYYSPRLVQVDSLAKMRRYVYNYSGLMGAGNILSTTGDLRNYDRALYSKKILSGMSLDLAFQPTILNNGEKVIAGRIPVPSYYGLGWFIMADSSAGKIVWHTGADPGELNIFLRNLSRHQFVAVLDNTGSDGLFTTGSTGMDILDHRSLAIRKKSIADILAKDIFSKGVDFALAHVLELRADTAQYYYAAGEVAYIGRELLDGGYDKLAIEVFRINVLLSPEVPVALNNYADALIRSGKKEEAIRIYRRSISIRSANNKATEALKKLE
jgi:CubicO group peptidase (beta-lactamase class C family)